LVNPDFTAVAQAYGMVGIRVDRTEEFAEAFSAAAASATGGIIELDISVEAITPRTTLSALKANR
jgi:acetolactate synthase-1/2/3 large subunit